MGGRSPGLPWAEICTGGVRSRDSESFSQTRGAASAAGRGVSRSSEREVGENDRRFGLDSYYVTNAKAEKCSADVAEEVKSSIIARIELGSVEKVAFRFQLDEDCSGEVYY